MIQLQDLSTELLLAIISHTSHPALPALVLTSRRLHDLATPKLYQSVYFWGSGHLDFFSEVGDFIDRTTSSKDFLDSISPAASRVFNLDAFARSLESSKFLLSAVQDVDLTWHNDGPTNDKEVQRILQILGSTSLKRLHLSPPDPYVRIPNQAPITAFSIRSSWYGDRDRGGWESELPEDLDFLYDICCFSSMTRLSVDGFQYWGGEEDIQGYSGQKETKASNVSQLALRNTGTPGNGLQQLISWPKALRTLSIEASPDSYAEYLDTQFSSEKLYNVLRSQRETLEELCISCNVCEIELDDSDLDDSRSIILRDFPRLRRLRIRINFLNLRKRSISASLPPALEELHLETHDAFQASLSISETADFAELMARLEEIATSKSARFPALAKVAFGSAKNRPSYGLYETMESSVIGGAVKAACEKAEIQLHCWSATEASPDLGFWQQELPWQNPTR